LVEYMTTLKTPALSLDYWHVIGPFEGGLDKAFGPEKKVDLSATYAGKKGKVAWRAVKPGAGGYVDLRAVFSPRSDGIVSYLTREVDSPVEQEATVLLGTDEGVKLWVNGALVHTSRAAREAAPEQDAVKVKLKKGVNTLLLKLSNAGGGHGFYFTLL